MRTQFVILSLCYILFLLLLFRFSSSLEDCHRNYDDPRPLFFEYKRLAEVEKQCSQFLSSGSKLELTDSKIESIKNELSFHDGDWEQQNNGLAPLMPFDESDLEISSAPLKLVNFDVIDVKLLEGMPNVVGLGGVMSIGITQSHSFSYDLRTMFYMGPGLSVLTMVFEGIYVETEENTGERVLCLFGKTMFPSRRWLQHWHNDYWGLDSSCPNPLQDDQILLILRYPKISRLNARAIQGEMRSLHEERSFKFFDKVLVSSRHGSSSCGTNAYQEELMEDGANNLSGSDFCGILQELSNEVFNILPDYHMNINSHAEIGELGPFVLENEVKFVPKSYNNIRLVIQDLKCNTEASGQNAKVSAVFSVIPAESDRFAAASRTGPSSMTLPAEGMWDSSTGQLCMTGFVPKGKEAQVSLYFPRALSIKQRSIVFGTISSSPQSKDAFSTLHFDVVYEPYYLELRYGWYADAYLSYNYSKIKQADEFRRRSSQSSNIMKVLRQSVLRYPAIQLEGGFFSLSQIYDLTNELYIDTELANGVGMSIKLGVTSIGSYLARYDFLYSVRSQGVLADAIALLNENDLLNVSVHLKFTKEPLQSVTHMFLEGLYDPNTGTMYLIGCGNVNTGIDVERGLDCLIEVKVQYPATNSRWLTDPTAQISITSQRNTDDPLYFHPIRFQSKTIPYSIFQDEDHKQDVVFREIFEGVLQVVVLAVRIVIIWSQKIYMGRNADSAPFVSLNMLACEILGYSILLITGEEVLFPSKETVSYRNQAYDIEKYQLLLRNLSFTAKLLALLTLFLNIRLFNHVSESRKRQNSLDSCKTPLVLGDRHYILRYLKRVTVTLLSLGSFTVMLSQTVKGTYTIQHVQVLLLNVLAHMGKSLQDFLLVAQISENWHCKSQVKSLRKVYYMGFSLVAILLQVYDHIRSPISDPYSESGPERLVLVLLFSDIKILGIIIQVIIIYIQQSFNYFWIIECFSVSRLLNLRKVKQLLFRRRHHAED